MKIFIGANVILDYLTEREPFVDDAEDVIGNLSTQHNDFEDSVQLACALAWGADVIISRDKMGFAKSPIPVFSPAEFVRR